MYLEKFCQIPLYVFITEDRSDNSEVKNLYSTTEFSYPVINVILLYIDIWMLPEFTEDRFDNPVVNVFYL